MAFGLVPTRHYARVGLGPRPRHAVPARHDPFKMAGQIGPIGISYFPNPNPNLTAYAHPPPVVHSSRSLRSALARSPPRPVGSLAVLASPAIGSLPSRCSPRFRPVSPRFPRGAHRLTGSPPRPIVHRLAPSSVDVDQGEDPQAMYNRLKTLVNQVRNLRSTKWDDHEMVKVILRSLVFLNPTQVQLICGNPRYTLMSPEEVIGNFVIFELMIKGSKKIIELDGPSMPEAQPVAFKAMKEKRRSLHQVDNPSMPLSSTMRRWRSSSRTSAKSSSKGGGRTTNPTPRKYATSVVSPVISLLNVHYLVIVIGVTTRRGEERRRRGITRRRAAMLMFAGSGTPTRAPPTPPPTRTSQTSPSPRVFSSQTSATSASWQRTAK
jgi:hypothetical protein